MNNGNSKNDNKTPQVVYMPVNQNQREAALKVLFDFVGDFDEDEVQNRITQAIDTCLISDIYYFEKAIERENLQYVMRNISKVAKALYVLFERKAA